MSRGYKHIKSFNFRSHNFTHRCLNHSILASLERILHEISNDKSNTQNGDLEDYQKKLFKVDCTNGGHNTKKGNIISNGLWCSEDLN